MTPEPSDVRQQLITCDRHALVLGGPGSGKTTLALRKAAKRIDEGLHPGQSVMFLSFSRAAVARVAEVSRIGGCLPRHHRSLLDIQTFHSFFWEILRSHAYLLGAPRRLRILQPQDERALCKGIDEDDREWPVWLAHRERLFMEEGRIAFDLFAPHTRRLLEGVGHLRRVIGGRFPLIIVDEAQDTGPDAWGCIELLAAHSQVICLADLEQQIFDYLPGIGPERVSAIEGALRPLRLDLGTDNKRSPGTEIVEFGNDILAGRVRGGPYAGVSRYRYRPQGDPNERLRVALAILQRCIRAKTGIAGRSLAILVPYGPMAARASAALNSGTKPVKHKLLFDQTEALLSARLVAFLLEPKLADRRTADVARCLELLGAIKAAAGSRAVETLFGWSRKLLGGQRPRAKVVACLEGLNGQLSTSPLSGNPRSDWLRVKTALRASGSPELGRVAAHLDYLIGFNRGKRIAGALSDLWQTSGDYTGACDAVDVALAEDQILGNLDDPPGLQIMTIHKAKGKQFDGVIVIREGTPIGPGLWRSSIVWPGDDRPFRRSRKILRVAITRARHHVLLVEPVFPPCPILSPYTL